MKRNATFPTPAIPAGLTPEQADGLACVFCGRMDTPQKPVGTRDGVQLFACTPTCPPDDAAGLLTDAQTTPVYDEGLDGYRTARVETELRDVDSISSDAENARTPLFAAELVVADRAEIWFGYGTTIGEVTPGKAREIAATMRDFADRLEALCDVADGIAADDYEVRG